MDVRAHDALSNDRPLKTDQWTDELGPAAGLALDGAWLRDLAISCGADDAGAVSLGHPDLVGERSYVLEAFPETRAVLSIVCRFNPDAVRSPLRSIGNLEFHHNIERINEVAATVVRRLNANGIRALNPAAGFPMEMDRFPGRIWVVSHKPVAVAAGLGRIGIHRSVIHPKFGSFINLATVLIARDVASELTPLEFNPCLECKLCVAACPVGAIAPDGHFNFSACYTHNYREFMGGFTDWVENIADSGSAKALRGRVTDAEQTSMWQSLAFGANYKAAYCLAVCPAGEDVRAPWLASKANFIKSMLQPLQEKAEPVYVIPGSDAEEHVARRYPHKTIRRVHSGLRPRTIADFIGGLPNIFQRGKAKGLDATYHFTFNGAERREVTIVIRNRKLTTTTGLSGKADLSVIADARSWLSFVRHERGLLRLLLTRKLRFKGPARLLVAFGRCFPA